MSSNFKTTIDNNLEQNVITTNISNGSSSSAMILPEYTATISLVFLTSILAIGVLGNLLVIIVIRTSKEQTGGGAREGGEEGGGGGRRCRRQWCGEFGSDG